MNRKALLLAALLLTTPACVGPQPAASAPKLSVQEISYDFGVVEQGTPISHAFLVNNGGGLALSLDNVRPSCDCAAEVAPKRVLPPGGAATIEVHCETTGAAGRWRKTISVYSNDPGQPVAVLTLAGQVTAGLAAEPARLYVGHLGRGEAAANAIGLSGPAGVASVDSTGPVLEPAFSSGREADGSRRIQVRVRAPAPLGRFDETIRVRGAGGQPALDIPVTGIVDGDLVASPDQLSFGVTAPNAQTSRALGLHNRGDRPIRVTAARLVPPLGTASVTADRDNHDYRVTVKLNPGLGPGKFSGTLELEIDAPEQRRLAVPFSGRVVEKPS